MKKSNLLLNGVSMSESIQKFEELLAQKEIELENWSGEDDGSRYFAFEESIKNGPRIRVVAALQDKPNFVGTVYLFNYINISEEKNKEAFYELLNELNDDYTYVKFILDDEDNIMMRLHYPVLEGLYDAQTTIDFMLMATDAAKEEYSKFMKLIL
ncbi:MAG TPA: YbjN domain-containing protein [Melioribacteraceae bacterium]|nr:YbjN domain-containing protein [Melioribacteraceae bacterium]